LLGLTRRWFNASPGDEMTISLRPHHLLCLLTYAGEGYSAAFTASFDGIAARIAAGEDIRLVMGPDDVCAPLLDSAEAHCRLESVAERDDQAADALMHLLVRSIRPGERLTLDVNAFNQMRRAFLTGSIRKACAGCEWAGSCTAIAADGYLRTRLAGIVRSR
jgi:uncharacterized protein